MNGRQAKKLRREARRQAKVQLSAFHQQRTRVHKKLWFRILMHLVAWRVKLLRWPADPEWMKRMARKGCRIEVVS